MQRAISIGLVVAAIWVGITVYQEGIDQAFGGTFAGAADFFDTPSERGDTHRSLDAMQRLQDRSVERANRALGDERFRD